jgi:prophage antirepressor-like protein
MNELSLFEYETGNVRAKMIDGVPWFVAKDVCDSLSILDSSQAVERLESDEKLIRTLYVSGQSFMTVNGQDSVAIFYLISLTMLNMRVGV